MTEAEREEQDEQENKKRMNINTFKEALLSGKEQSKKRYGHAFKIEVLQEHTSNYFLTSKNPMNLDFRTVKNNFSKEAMYPILKPTEADIERQKQQQRAR